MAIKPIKLLSLFLIVAVCLSGCGLRQKVPSDSVDLSLKNSGSVSDTYDLIVMGGEPEGIAAAVSAARNGVKTLLLCESNVLGGLYTEGELNFIDVPETREGKVLVKGIYQEFSDKVGGSGFDVNQAKQVFHKMVTDEPNLTLRVNAAFKAPIMKGNIIQGVTVTEDGKDKNYYGKEIIDATSDADVAAAAGAPYTYAGEDIGDKDRQMGVTLVFGLKGLDWDTISKHVNVQRAKAELSGKVPESGAKGNIAWGYVREGYGYKPADKSTRLRGFNMSRQNDGTVLFNSLIIFDVDPLDEKSREDGIRRGKEELKHIVPYMRKTCKGFEEAELAHTASRLYVRESRHITCEYNLTIDDVLENRSQPDMIAVTNYPVDVQPTKVQTFGTVVGFPDQYAIGFRSLVPLKTERLMVVGRSAGYRSMAAGSARIVPTGMACGQAAGAAAAILNQENITPREMSKRPDLIKKLQDMLIKQGASLEHQQVVEPVMNHWAYAGVKVMRAMGALDGGYDNNYHLDEPISKNGYQNLVNNVLRKAGFPPKEPIIVNDNPPVRQIVGTMARAVGERQGKKYDNDFQVYMNVLKEAGIMTPDLVSYFSDKEKNPNKAEVVMLTARFYTWLVDHAEGRRLIAVPTLDDERGVSV